ncbi:MAG: hypothetical protein WBC51_02835 [Vicinamibacterales bacterium]
MATAHRFLVLAIAVLCSLVWPTPRDLVHRLTVDTGLTATVVLPTYIEPRRVSVLPRDACATDVPAVHLFWGYLRDLVVRQVLAIARWFSSRLDAVSPVPYRRLLRTASPT